MKTKTLYSLFCLVLTGCALVSSQPTNGVTPDPPTAVPTMKTFPDPASAYCEQQGYQLVNHTAADGSQSSSCLFPDGSQCDEWAYFRGECVPANQEPVQSPTPITPADPTEIPTPMPINPSDYQGFWTYTHPVYGFSIMLPEDWIVDQTTTANPQMNDHTLILRSKFFTSLDQSIRMTFRKVGEDVPLWPTGVGQGEFIPQGTLDIAGQPAERILLVCPTGEVTSIWYHQAEGQPNIARGDLEFGFIFNATSTHCEAGKSLSGKIQMVGEMIIASLSVP